MEKPTKARTLLSHVRLELAREKDHPAGDRDCGYDLMVPLDAKGKLDAVSWNHLREEARVRRFWTNQPDRVGLLRRKPGGQWYFDYGPGEADDEIGFRFGEECFVPGEYVSIKSAGAMHTFQVVLARKP